MEPACHLVLGLSLPHGMDWIWVALVALLIFGSKLPQVMRNLGGSVREFKKGMEDSGGLPTAPVIAPTVLPHPQRVEGAAPPDARALPGSAISAVENAPPGNLPS